MTPAVQQVVEFAKRVPGFNLLPQDDQLILIKVAFANKSLLFSTTVYLITEEHFNEQREPCYLSRVITCVCWKDCFFFKYFQFDLYTFTQKSFYMFATLTNAHLPVVLGFVIFAMRLLCIFYLRQNHTRS